MRRAAFCIATLLTIGCTAGAAAPLTSQEHAIFANLLAEEFTSVCIKSDALQGAVEDAALRRGWRPRPVEITDAYRPQARAWEGDVRQINVGPGVARKKLEFVAAVTDEESPTGRECTLLSDDLSFASLRDAMKNQGFDLHLEQSWGGQRRYEHLYAVFCSPRLSAEKKKHDIIVQWRHVPDRPLYNGARLVFARDSSVSRTICPQTVSLGGHGPEVDYPKMEPWLGQRPDGPPAPVGSEPVIDED